MLLEKWTTLQMEHIQLLAEELAKQQIPFIAELEPIADFEELLTFSEANPTPVEFTPQHPAWRLESVAARVIEGVAAAAHEPLTEFGYRELARILLEHTVYLYAYPDGEPRPRLEAGSALALVGGLCASLPQSELWRLAGFGRVSTALAEVTPAPTDSYLTLPIDVAFSLANEQNLPILASAIDTYNAVLKRNVTLKNRFDLPLSDSDFFEVLNLDFPGMETVKTAVLADDIPTAKTAYTAFRRQFVKNFVGGVSNPDVPLLERSDTYTTAKTYLECLLRLSIHPTPAITATTEIGIAAHLFPEFRGNEQLRKLALQRYKWISDAFFHADGFHKDRTLRAQTEAVSNFARFLRFPSDEQTQELRMLLEKLLATCIHLSQPDCSFPPLGPLPASNFDAVELCAIADSSFKCPDTTSHALPETDCYIMRDNWQPDGQYLFFDALPKGDSKNADISSLALYAHGRQLATSTVRLLGRTLTVSDVPDTQWITTPVFDFVEKWCQAAAVHHKRGIFYLKGEYFIFHDLVLGAEAQTLEQTFHLGGGIDTHIDADTGHTWTEDARRSNLFIGATDMTDLTVALAEDSVIYRRNSEPPAASNTLLFPMKSGVKAHPTLSAIPVDTDADVLGTGFTLALPNTTDTFLISDDGLAEMSAGDIRFVGEYLFLRRDASGSVQFIMLNGRFLKVGTKVLADLDEPCESYVEV
ncbi:MAG: heparinase II/III family protein [Candidatus Poribacteria bacterium]|nr:heparinase II/III family protein [Candidatus Poribacteria bacterium]